MYVFKCCLSVQILEQATGCSCLVRSPHSPSVCRTSTWSRCWAQGSWRIASPLSFATYSSPTTSSKSSSARGSSTRYAFIYSFTFHEPNVRIVANISNLTLVTLFIFVRFHYHLIGPHTYSINLFRILPCHNESCKFKYSPRTEDVRIQRVIFKMLTILVPEYCLIFGVETQVSTSSQSPCCSQKISGF